MKSKINWWKSNNQMIWITWSELLYKSIINSEKDNKKKEKKILEKVNRNETRIRKKIMNSQWIKNILTTEKQIFSRTTIERRNYVFIMRKRDIKSKNTEVYNKKSQWKHEHK